MNRLKIISTRVIVSVLVLLGSQTATAQSNQAEKDNFNLAGFPFILYQPETSLILGGGAAATFRQADQERPDNINLYAIYSLKQQTVLHLQPDFYFDEGKTELNVVFYYQNYPAVFFGVGNNTRADDAENYTTEDVMVQPWLLRQVHKDLRLGVMADYNNTAVVKTESGGMLENGTLLGADGSRIAGLGAVVAWDSRDNIFYPTAGSWLKFYCTFYDGRFGSELDFVNYTLDFRHYLQLNESHVLAMQIYSRVLTGDIAFNKFARLQHLRGINESRFRDKTSTFARLEYRYPIRNRFSGVVFAGVGDVAPTLGALEPAALKMSGGLGLRFALIPEEGMNLRFDIGISEYGVFPYFQISEAF